VGEQIALANAEVVAQRVPVTSFVQGQSSVVSGLAASGIFGKILSFGFACIRDTNDILFVTFWKCALDVREGVDDERV
jgi:hypothetical protein